MERQESVKQENWEKLRKPVQEAIEQAEKEDALRVYIPTNNMKQFTQDRSLLEKIGYTASPCYGPATAPRLVSYVVGLKG